MRSLKTLARGLIYPVLVTASLGASLWGVRLGFGPVLVTATVNAAGAILVLALERLLPYAPEWNRSRGDIATDTAHALLSNPIAIAMFRAAFLGPLTGAAAGLSAHCGFGLWPTAWPLALQLGLAILVAELPEYWYHRLLHHWAPGWRLHSVHHSAERLYWLNGLRGHPLDLFGSFAVQQAPLVLLGAPSEVLVLAAGFIGINGLFKHSNVDLRLGPLNWLISSAELHRWHHVPKLADSLCNYGNNLIVWDVVFGTRSLPKGRRPSTDIGLPEMPAFPKGYLGQLAAPFRWRRLVASAEN